jgi:hypothetical protein
MMFQYKDKMRTFRQRSMALLCIGFAVALLATGCSDDSGSKNAKKNTECFKQLTENGKKKDTCLAIAPTKKRIDLIKPKFSHPTEITNPLHPTSKVDQIIFGGQVDDKPFRTEVTLLPGTKTIIWNKQKIEARISQYVAFSDGRIQEVALDWYAQDDAGNVWYLGEDVGDYKDGVVDSTEGTWIAGKDGPAAMIMPAEPKVDGVYRTENAYPTAFEEVTIKAVNQTIAGPYGKINGAMVVTELHMDGSREDKTFAPGYGEFSTGEPNGDLEAVSLAAPTDTIAGPIPAALKVLSGAVREVYNVVGKNDMAGAAGSIGKLQQAWNEYRASGVPPIFDKQMNRDIDSLATALQKGDANQARQATLRVAQNDLDIQIRHRPVDDVDRARLDLWARQMGVDIAAGATGDAVSDMTTLEFIRDRVVSTLDKTTADRLNSQLAELRKGADKKDLTAMKQALAPLAETISAIQK